MISQDGIKIIESEGTNIFKLKNKKFEEGEV